MGKQLKQGGLPGFVVPPKGSRLGPCPEVDCGHESCERLRTIAASPCTLCRAVIGYGKLTLDERSEVQRDRDIFYVGFTHYDCRRRWKLRYTPQPHKPDKPKRQYRPPVIPTPIHLDDEPLEP